MTARLEGKSIIVTGAGRGLGKGIATRLAADGATVTVADINGPAAEQVAAAIRAAGGSARAATVDVAERSQVQELIRDAVAAVGPLDVIFNNAGISQARRFLDIEEADFERLMRVNGLGVLIGTQEAAKQFIAQGGGGKVVNTASVAGKQGFPLFAHYCATKFAVVALTQAAARALASHGITVNAICPGVVGTELWAQLDEEFLRIGETTRAGQALEDFSTSILLGRVADPEDIAGFATFLASADSDYVTGQSIQIDGGMVLQ